MEHKDFKNELIAILDSEGWEGIEGKAKESLDNLRSSRAVLGGDLVLWAVLGVFLKSYIETVGRGLGRLTIENIERLLSQKDKTIETIVKEGYSQGEAEDISNAVLKTVREISR